MVVFCLQRPQLSLSVWNSLPNIIGWGTKWNLSLQLLGKKNDFSRFEEWSMDYGDSSAGFPRQISSVLGILASNEHWCERRKWNSWARKGQSLMYFAVTWWELEKEGFRYIALDIFDRVTFQDVSPEVELGLSMSPELILPVSISDFRVVTAGSMNNVSCFGLAVVLKFTGETYATA